MYVLFVNTFATPYLQVEHPPASHKQAWRKLISTQRKRAVMACFRMIPLHNMPRHRAINMFLKSFQAQWLGVEETGTGKLIEDLTVSWTHLLKIIYFYLNFALWALAIFIFHPSNAKATLVQSTMTQRFLKTI